MRKRSSLQTDREPLYSRGHSGRYVKVRTPARLYSLLLIIPLAGCGGGRYRNVELTATEQPPAPAEARGYRFEQLRLGPGNTDGIFVCLTFSGGGTRAAALAYGVLARLNQHRISDPAAGERSLIDEVDIISSVSGGSFTALKYGLEGKGIFSGDFERNFLFHNVTLDLVTTVLFENLLILPSVFPDRIHLAADYCSERIFAHKTYSDLRPERPFIVANATNMASGQRFEFTQDEFDVLGSDLQPLPLGEAAMASSAVPVLLSPLRLKYYDNDGSRRAIEQTLTSGIPPGRARWAKTLVPETQPGEAPRYTLDRAQHQFLYLLDGAVSDNLGISHVFSAYRWGPIGQRLRPAAPHRIERLVIIVVDAGNNPPETLESRKVAPGVLEMAFKAVTIPIEVHSDAMVEMARYGLTRVPQRVREQYAAYCKSLEACPSAPPLEPPPECGHETYLIDVDLSNVPDPQQRRRFLSMPTRLDLPRQDVADLIRIGGDLLDQDSEFKKLLEALGAH